LKEGDANTRYFHLRVNARRRKNLIHRLKHNNGWVTEHEQKKAIIQNHFKKIIKKGPPREKNFNWANIPTPQCDLGALGDPFTEEEAKAAVDRTASDKAPGPDGFTGAFFKASWDTIKGDIMAVINKFSGLRTNELHWLNSANIALIPKKDGAEDISDFRPISLIHAIAKLISKMMAARLAPHMNKLVSNSQSAFIKTRSIHDNFLYVRNLARKLHKSRIPSLLFKLDIKKAFDSVRWDYLMDLLQHLGFPSTFRNWVLALLSTSTSRVLLNGITGDPIKHGRGLRQGDPLSPLLFVMAIDPLHHILSKATQQGNLHKLRGRTPTIRTSLYADDAAIFVTPTREDISFLASTLDSFGNVTGLVTNCEKSQVAAIRCDGLDLDNILQAFPATRVNFPMKYLGLPLSVHRLKRIHFQPLEDKVAAKLAPWIGKHVNMAGRSTLVKAVLTSIAIYYITALEVPMEVLTKIDGIRRAYLWAACDKITGGKCKVAWEKVCKPKEFGGLGILNLKKFASALRMRWLWYEWKEESKPWVGLGNPCTPHDKELFSAATKVTIGSGKKAIFWDSSWLNGLRPRDVAPLIFDISKKKKITVAKALLDDFWITQINMQDGISIQHIVQFTNLWEMLQDVHLDPNSSDTIAWKLTNNKEYSAKSAYSMQFLGHTSSLMPTLVWKPWAPPKCKIFAWPILQNRVWTADRLEKRGWQNCGLCKLCNQVHESGAHLLFKCRFTIRIWRSLKEWLGLSDLEPREWNNITSVKEWWNIAINKKGEDRRGLASLAMLVSWEVWNERNGRVFRNKFSTANMVILKIKEEANCWSLAGAKALGSLMMRE
jgi:mannosylglycoprotein endo-beta-mannosidase